VYYTISKLKMSGTTKNQSTY